MSSCDDLSLGPRLEYLFAKAAGFEMFGEEGGPFALRDKENEQIAVFGGSPPVHASFTGNFANVPLKMAQKLGASLTAVGDLVVCEIGTIRKVGDTYSEAAMRAVIAHLAGDKKG
jgi:hypothetical protein